MSGNIHIRAFAWVASIALLCAAFYQANAPRSDHDDTAINQTLAAQPEVVLNPSPHLDSANAESHPLLNSNRDLTSLHPDDVAALQSLPAICTAEIPGVAKEELPDCPATDDIAELPAYVAMKNSQREETKKTNSAEPATPLWQPPAAQQNSSKPKVDIRTRAENGPGSGWNHPDRRATFLDTNSNSNFNELSSDSGSESDQHVAATLAAMASSIPSTLPDSPLEPDKVQLASWSEDDFANYNPHARATADKIKTSPGARERLAEMDVDPHFEAFSRTAFPSAVECAKCHEQIFEEWASSSHAYSAISPMFHVFEDRINKLASGTIGYFCMRCHAPVATTMGLRRDQPIWDGPRVFREGVTCVACHRVNIPYGKVNGERRMIPGGSEAPVYGGSDGKGVHLAAQKYADYFKTKIDPNSKKPGQVIHRKAIQFEELSKSSFCVSCHQVAVEPGIKLEVVWDQYRGSPAYREGVTCQACHMGAIPGVDSGYTYGPAAVVDGKVVNPERKHSNHIFYGPGYSIAHPGIFPHNAKADQWTVNQWLTFDWRAGWGTEEFEDSVAQYPNAYFPPPWDNADARMDAREIVDLNLKKLDYKLDVRIQTLENGSKLDGPFFAETPQLGKALKFRYCLTNINPGHNMPSGSLGAQPQIWLNAVLTNPSGIRIWETGYLDSNGDLCDNHSLDVLARKAPFDTQLLNLQTKFFVTNVKGTDREMYLPVPYEQDQLPFLRPAAQPVTVINHPVGIRMEGHSLPPLGSRNVKYSVPSRLINERGTYTLSVRLRSRAEPIYFMRFCGATPEMIRSMNEWIANFHEQTVVFEVH